MTRYTCMYTWGRSSSLHLIVYILMNLGEEFLWTDRLYWYENIKGIPFNITIRDIKKSHIWVDCKADVYTVCTTIWIWNRLKLYLSFNYLHLVTFGLWSTFNLFLVLYFRCIDFLSEIMYQIEAIISFSNIMYISFKSISQHAQYPLINVQDVTC